MTIETKNPAAADCLGDWIRFMFDYHVEFISRGELEDSIRIDLPPVVRENGMQLNRYLTLTFPKYSLFEVDGVSICDPAFFIQFKKFIERHTTRFDKCVEQFMKDGTVPKLSID